MKKPINASLYLFMVAFTTLTSIYACTNITIKAKDGAVMVARSMEFGPNLKSEILTSPKGRKVTTTGPEGQTGKSWTTKYGFLFLNFFGQDHAVDGMNTKGLSFGYLYMPGYTKYPAFNKKNPHSALPYLSFGDWVLGNFATVDEVKKGLSNISVFSMPKNIGPFKNMIFPLHAMITDSSGKSITIEFLNGKMKVYDNKDGIMTNAPPYIWQLNNLKNFSNLTPYSPKTIKLYGVTYAGTGQGSGAVGLPGDFSPPSRFVKMTFMSHSAYPVANATEALNLAQHIINDVDIPIGVVRGDKGSKSTPDRTQWTVFKDLNSHILYFKSYDNTTLQSIQLDQLKFDNTQKQLSMPVSGKQLVNDITQSYSKAVT